MLVLGGACAGLASQFGRISILGVVLVIIGIAAIIKGIYDNSP